MYMRYWAVRGSTVSQYGSGTLNSQFQNVAISPNHLGADDYTIPQKSKAVNSFTLSRIPISLVLSHLNSLNPAKSIGPDALPAKFLREISNKIAAPFTDIFNHS